jgi:hypothetical protein
MILGKPVRTHQAEPEARPFLGGEKLLEGSAAILLGFWSGIQLRKGGEKAFAPLAPALDRLGSQRQGSPHLPPGQP